MILYNVTVKISNAAHDDWLKWMREVHIPDVMATGLFLEKKICRIFDDETEGTTYAIQYYTKDMTSFEEYQNTHAKALQKEHTDRYENQYFAFRTLMEVLD